MTCPKGPSSHDKPVWQVSGRFWKRTGLTWQLPAPHSLPRLSGWLPAASCEPRCGCSSFMSACALGAGAKKGWLSCDLLRAENFLLPQETGHPGASAQRARLEVGKSSQWRQKLEEVGVGVGPCTGPLLLYPPGCSASSHRPWYTDIFY